MLGKNLISIVKSINKLNFQGVVAIDDITLEAGQCKRIDPVNSLCDFEVKYQIN